MKKLHLKSGYSIIEIIIYVSVFAVVSIIIANAFIVLVSFFNQSRTNHDLLQNGNTALERISTEIRIATAVKGTSVLGTSPGVLELDSFDSNDNAQVIKFAVVSGALNIYKDDVLIGNMLGPNVTVTSLIFREVATTNSKVVKVEMTLKDSRDKTGLSESFSNIIVLPKEVSGSSSGGGSSSSSAVSLLYDGIHAGDTGLTFQAKSSDSYIGNIYSIGPIKLNYTARVTGSLTSGGPSGSIAYASLWDHEFGYIVSGNSSAHTVQYNTTTGTIFCQSGANNNKSCTSQSDPVVSALPDLTSQIDILKAEATAGDVYSFDTWTNTWTIGPKKIVGNLSIFGDVILTGPLWVTGNLSIIQSGQKVKLPSSFGTRDGVIISDGLINVGTQGAGTPAVIFEGSGVSDSNILMISTAIDDYGIIAKNVSGNVLLYAGNGYINGAGLPTKVKGIIAKFIQLGGNASADVTVEHVPGTTSLKFDQATFSVTP